MNSNQRTLQKLEAMRLHGMVRAFRSTMDTGVRNQLSPDELVSHLVDSEWDERNNRKIARLLRTAKFRYPATFEEIDFSLTRNLEKNQILRLSDSGWIERHQNILLTGPTGVGNYVKFLLM